MPASAVDEEVAMPTELKVCVGLHAPDADPLVGGCGSGSSSSRKVAETDKKQTMQSDGQVVGDTSTCSEDEQQQRVMVGTGLPPIAPVTVETKASLFSEPKEGGEQTEDKDQMKTATATEVARPPIAAKKPGKVNAKLGKVKVAKKVAAKSERVDRRRKRKAKAERDTTGISQASAKMLFQCSCQLLRSQTLDYDVRAREMEDRNAEQAKEIDEWEKRIRSLKRELEEYADEQSEAQPDETTSMALVEAEPDPAVLDEQKTDSAAFGAGAALPSAVAAAETKLQEELRKRSQKVNEFSRSIPGFLGSPLQDKQAPRYF